ncbi:2-oxoglutarate dehydrogenase E1 component [Sesbania bispinosa]|nr:2-oxoglutarate dehydrogenase E1 component [Sesbania bispinosa]
MANVEAVELLGGGWVRLGGGRGQMRSGANDVGLGRWSECKRRLNSKEEGRHCHCFRNPN